MKNNIFSVGQVNAYIKKMFDTDFVLKNIWIQGEISNCKIHSSGHIYFTLKDYQGAINCVLFKGNRQFIKFDLKDGMKVIARGSISVYERTGQYQLYVRDMIQDGIGLLYQKFEELKKSLEKKGLFSKEYKKEIPRYPRKVGIVTSDTGAAIRDIVNVAKRRNPTIQLILYPSLVQGDEAKYNIIEGIHYLDKIEDVDIIIVGRGGGSIEDLWPFNEEIVAKAIFEAKTPIISAVGHETDFTISDFVADLRAPTPSAGAELAIPLMSDIEELLSQYKYKLNHYIQLKIENLKNNYKLKKSKLALYDPKNKLSQYVQYIGELEDKLNYLIENEVKDSKNKINLLYETLKRVSPIEKFREGYAYLLNFEKQHIKTINNVNKDDEIFIKLIDGEIKAKVLDITSKKFEEI